jgi:poly-gamma-glutamate synthesis protein (capsule biosynthesis protein)
MIRFLEVSLSIVILSFSLSYGQESDFTSKQSLTLMFVGDVMGHGPQITSALDKKTGKYDYEDVFSRMAPVFGLADFVIANLEVTLAGPPYSGYPQFSSPDELADGLTNAGVNVLVTANNHTVDRGKKGITRTIDVLNDKKIPFAGAYKDSLHRDSTYPLILEQNGIRLAILNYTYGTNGIPVPSPTIVNLIDTALIRADYLKAKTFEVDEVIAFMHWGVEYQRAPSVQQIWLTQFMHNLGIRLVIGSHPHVVQRMEASFDTDSTEARVAVYSLGNFVSNQRPRYRNGGVIAAVQVEKENGVTRISNAGYVLAWVQTSKVGGKRQYRVLPVAKYEHLSNYFTDDDKDMFNEFATDSRLLFDIENYNVPEIGYRNGNWVIPWASPTQKFPRRIRRIEPWRKEIVYPEKVAI